MPTQEELDRELDTGTRGENASQSEGSYMYDSFAGVLKNAIGYFISCEFLTGNNIVEKNGILRAVGVNFITLTDPDADTNTICDMYSLKFCTVYATKIKPPQFRRNNNRNNIQGNNYNNNR